MIVCIAEKPSVAQDIAKVIGATKRHTGYFEGNGYQVTWTYGHLCCLKAPEEYNEQDLIIPQDKYVVTIENGVG